MPIRMNRGRAAVWRRVWGWPLRSARHLLATTGILVLLAAGLALASGNDGSEPTSSPVRPKPAPSAPAPPPPATSDVQTPGVPVPITPTGPVPPPPEALQTATAFADHLAQVTPGMSNPQWLTQIRPYVTPETGGLLETVDPANAAEIHRTGGFQATAVTPSVVHLSAPLQQGTLLLVLINTDGRWLVQSYDQGP